MKICRLLVGFSDAVHMWELDVRSARSMIFLDDRPAFVLSAGSRTGPPEEDFCLGCKPQFLFKATLKRINATFLVFSGTFQQGRLQEGFKWGPQTTLGWNARVSFL